MGAAASLDLNLDISLDKAKEIAGDLWNDSLQQKFVSAINQK